MNYTSNVTQVVRFNLERLNELSNPDVVLRSVALAVLPEVRKRVHTEGKNSNGAQIGEYSKEYMVVRTGNYKDAAKFKRGEKAGQFKTKKKAGDAGSFTAKAGDKAGKVRPVYNRTADTKVVASLTRQMENDLSVVPSGNGYGLGYLNAHNYDKSQWVEQTYKQKIWNLTAGEEALAYTVADEMTEQLLNSK